MGHRRLDRRVGAVAGSVTVQRTTASAASVAVLSAAIPETIPSMIVGRGGRGGGGGFENGAGLVSPTQDDTINKIIHQLTSSSQHQERRLACVYQCCRQAERRDGARERERTAAGECRRTTDPRSTVQAARQLVARIHVATLDRRGPLQPIPIFITTTIGRPGSRSRSSRSPTCRSGTTPGS